MKRGFLAALAVLCFPAALGAQEAGSGPDARAAAEARMPAGEITHDMFPETNRAIHGLNMRVMHGLTPEIERYRKEHSPAIHRGIGNFFRNLREPLTLVNALLQLDLEAAERSIFRFAVNSTIGLAGLIDAAADMNVKRDRRDFGQTLGSWGVPMGGFLVLPFYAQTNTRDLSGSVVDIFIDPLDIALGWPVGLALSLSSAAVGVYDAHGFIISTDEAAVDSYATFKTMYLQNRKEQVDRIRTSFSTGGGTESEAAPASAIYDFDMDDMDG